jgi:hypothetical protein
MARPEPADATPRRLRMHGRNLRTARPDFTAGEPNAPAICLRTTARTRTAVRTGTIERTASWSRGPRRGRHSDSRHSGTARTSAYRVDASFTRLERNTSQLMGRGRAARSPKTGLRPHRHHQHHVPGTPGQLERDETPDPKAFQRSESRVPLRPGGRAACVRPASGWTSGLHPAGVRRVDGGAGVSHTSGPNRFYPSG